MRIIDLKQKEVINTCNCKTLGCPVDVEFDPCSGRISAIIIPGPGKFCCFLGRDSEFCIPWECICQIGEDIILVEIDEKKCLKKLSLLSWQSSECSSGPLPDPLAVSLIFCYLYRYPATTDFLLSHTIFPAHPPTDPSPFSPFSIAATRRICLFGRKHSIQRDLP